eukprot:SAG31_NODE_5088_length_2749_cov_3.416226_1_plen_73_part_10
MWAAGGPAKCRYFFKNMGQHRFKAVLNLVLGVPVRVIHRGSRRLHSIAHDRPPPARAIAIYILIIHTVNIMPA